MSKEISFDGTREQLRKLLWSFLGSIGGGSGPFVPQVRGIKLRVGMIALACVQEAFIEKASGGTGEDGIQWPPLKKQTIANRRVGDSDIASMKSQGITKRQSGYGARKQGAGDLDSKGRLKRGFLTDAEDKRWKKIFASRKAQMMGKHGMSEGAASARAAQIAWAVLKSEGAKTKLEVLGNRKVMIGRDTGRLFNSLSPGVADPDSHPLLTPPPEVEERVLREEVGCVIVGTNVVYASAFAKTRPLWPKTGQLPAPWMQRIHAGAASGIAEAIEMIIQGAT
jgi:hypothetical protein